MCCLYGLEGADRAATADAPLPLPPRCSLRRALMHMVLVVWVLLLQIQSGGLDHGDCRWAYQRG